MLPLSFGTTTPLRVVCLGAHCDDIEIGAGGTMLTLAEAGLCAEVCWVVFCSNDARAKEAQRAADLFLGSVKKRRVLIKSFRDGYLPWLGDQVKDVFEQLKTEITPDVIFTHFRDDRHQDHRLISDLTWNTWRDHFILEYEIPKYDGDLGSPNFFVPLTEACCAAKVKYTLECFASQRSKHWLTEDTLMGLMRLRGIESGNGPRHAEAFYCRKSVLTTGRSVRDAGNSR